MDKAATEIQDVALDFRRQAGTVQPLAEGAEPLPGINVRRGFRFRRGQELFLRKLAAAFERGEYFHLGVFVPGYGKTITALSAFVLAHAMGVARKLVVFVPRGNLRDQYADPRELGTLFHNLGAPPFSFCVADSDKVFLKNIDTQIIITTYQYASGPAGNMALKRYCESAPCMFVFDEVHHLSDDGTWAQKIAQLPFDASIALSGTPMRSDNKTLFGVPFEERADGEQYYVALHEVNLRDAHQEGKILKRVEAHVIDYRIRMTRTDTGENVQMSLSRLRELSKSKSDIDAFFARKKLRFHNVYLNSLLRPAFTRFREKRRHLAEYRQSRGLPQGRNHQLLVIAMSNMHAAAVLQFVQEYFPQYSAARIGQDVAEQERLRLLEDYRQGRIDVMVQVDMIGEGTDIKPISVIVKADLVRAYSKTMQQVFRGMRYYKDFPEEANVCDMYASGDSEVVEILNWISNEEQIGIKQNRREFEGEQRAVPLPAEQAPWELTQVEHHRTETHSLELFPGFSRPEAVIRKHRPVREDPLRPAAAQDVSAREAELRQECAGLASRLMFLMRSSGKVVEVAQVHAEAKRRFGKAQEEMSIDDLQKKYRWLTACIAARKFV